MGAIEEYYRKRYESAMEAVAAMQRALDEAGRENARLTLERLQLKASQATQQQVMSQTINQANAANNAVLEENKRLREELRNHHCSGCDGSDNSE